MRQITILNNNKPIFKSYYHGDYDEERPLNYDLAEINYSFENLDFNHVDFCLIELNGNNLKQLIYFKYITFDDADFSSAKLTETYFNNCGFIRTRFTGTHFDKCSFVSCNFSNVMFDMIEAIECVFNNVNFTGCVCESSIFYFCKFINCTNLNAIPENYRQHCTIINN